MTKLIKGMNIRSARKGLNPAFLKMNQYGMSIRIENSTPKNPKNIRYMSECSGPNP
jgi:hypothetical protein